MAGQLVDRVREAGLTRVKAVAKRIATESPKLADLPEEDLMKLARAVVAEGLKDDLRKAADLEKVDYQAEREKFVARSSRTGSQRTKQLYSDALDKLDAWCRKQGLSTLELTPALADDWMESLKAEGKAASTIRLMVAAASSLWTWLERRHTELRNPFRGTRARPLNKPKRKLEIPTEAEIRIIENAAEGWLKAAIVLMSQSGLGLGRFPHCPSQETVTSALPRERNSAGRFRRKHEKPSRRQGFPCAHRSGTRLSTRLRMAFAI